MSFSRDDYILMINKLLNEQDDRMVEYAYEFFKTIAYGKTLEDMDQMVEINKRFTSENLSDYNYITKVFSRKGGDKKMAATMFNLYNSELNDYIANRRQCPDDFIVKLLVDNNPEEIDFPVNPLGASCLLNLSNHKFREVIHNHIEQKVAIKVEDIDCSKDVIEELLRQYISERYPEFDNSLSISEINDNGRIHYEMIAFNVVVKNGSDMSKFLEGFKEYLEGYDRTLCRRVWWDEIWSSVDDLKEEMVDNNKKFVTGFGLTPLLNMGASVINIQIDKLVNQVFDNSVQKNTITDSFNTNITHTNISKGKISNKDRFIKHIKDNRPEWYTAGKFIDIDTFYEEYKKFESGANAKGFATKFKDILWNEKKRSSFSSDGKTRYKLLDLWESEKE